MPHFDDTLQELLRQSARKQTLDAMVRELHSQCQQLRERVDQLRYQMEKEQYDVDRLEAGSLAAFFYGVVGKMDEKLDKERAEAYAARVKYDGAALELSALEEDLRRKEEELRSLAGCEERYRALLREKEEALKAAGGPLAWEILELEGRLAWLSQQLRELDEAIAAGETALDGADGVLSTLDSAMGWATWDVMGGGVFSDMAKYSRLDEAQRRVQTLQLQLDRFKTELADVTIQTDLQVSVGGFLQFADYFFDNLFTDWTVMNQISRSRDQVDRTCAQIASVLQGLRDTVDRARRERQDCRARLDRLVGEA